MIDRHRKVNKNFVSDDYNLEIAIRKIRSCHSIAIDTEFYWRYTYYPVFCLLQIATNEDVYIFDLIKTKIDVSRLNSIFFDYDICKIMHSADNDVRILKHFFKSQFNNIFDTQVAYDFLGSIHQISLKNLLANLKLIKLDKKEKLSDWRKRPLTEKQIEYAVSDVIYLHAARDDLINKMQENGNYTYFKEEMKSSFINVGFPIAKNAFQKIRNFHNIEGKMFSNVVSLSNWREDLAQRRNIRVNDILSDKDITLIAEINPQNNEDFFKNFESKHFMKFSKTLVAILNTSFHQKNIKKEKILLPKKILQEMFDLFKNLCQLKKITYERVSARKDFEKFIESIPKGLDNLSGKLKKGWRYRIFGEKIINFFNNRSAENLPYNEKKY